MTPAETNTPNSRDMCQARAQSRSWRRRERRRRRGRKKKAATVALFIPPPVAYDVCRPQDPVCVLFYISCMSHRMIPWSQSLLTFPVLQQRPAQQAEERAYVRSPDGSFCLSLFGCAQCRDLGGWKTDFFPNVANMRSLSSRNMK